MIRSSPFELFALVVGTLAFTACAPAAPPPAATQPPAKPAAASPVAKPAASPAEKPAAKPAAKAEPVKVTIATSGSGSEVGWMVAEEKGYFKEMGFELDIQRGIGSNDRFAILAKGDLDMTNISPSAAMFNAIKRGIDLKLVAVQQVLTKGRHGNVAIVVRKELYDNGTLDSINKLKGKTIALSGTGGIGNIQMDKTIKKAGLSPSDVTLKYLGLNEMLPAVAGGQVDGALVFGLLQLEAEKQGIGKPIIFGDDMYPDAIVSVWLYSQAFAAKTDIARRWMVPYIKGVRDYTDAYTKGKDKETVINAMIKYTSTKDRAVYDQISWPNILADSKFEVKTLSDIQDWFADEGLLTAGKVDLRQVVDTQFIDYAVRELGPHN